MTVHKTRDGAEATVHPVDKGWSWVIMAAAFVVHFFSLGYERSFGLLYVEFQESMGGSSTLISSVIGAKSIAYCISALVVMNLAVKKISVRTSCVIGCVLQSTAVATSSLATSPATLICTQGLLFGVGHGMLYCPTLLILSQYFQRYRPITTALASCGCSLGGIAFPMITRRLLAHLGLPGTLLILGGTLLHQLLVVILYTPPEEYTSASLNSKDEAVDITQQNPRSDWLKDDSQEASEKKDNVSFNDVKEKGSLTFDECVDIDTEENEEEEISLQSALITTRHSGEDDNMETKLRAYSLNKPKEDTLSIEDVRCRSDENVTSKEASRTFYENKSDCSSNLIRKACLNNHHIHSQPALHNHHIHSQPALHNHHIHSQPALHNHHIHSQPALHNHHIHSQPALHKQTSTKSSLTNRRHHSISHEFLKALSDSVNGLNQIHSSLPMLLYEDRKVTTRSPFQDEPNGHSEFHQCRINGDPAGYAKNRGRLSDLRIACQGMLTVPDVMRLPMFWVLLVYFMGGVVGTGFPAVYIPSLANEVGLSREDGAHFLMISALTEIVGRFLPGTILNLNFLTPTQLMFIPMMCLGTLYVMTPMFVDYTSLLCLTLFYGMMGSSFWTVQTLVVIQVLGMEHLASAMGFNAVFMGLVCSLSFPFGGLLQDVTGTYSSTFIFLGAMYFLAVASLVVFELVSRRNRKAEDDDPKDEEVKNGKGILPSSHQDVNSSCNDP